MATARAAESAIAPGLDAGAKTVILLGGVLAALSLTAIGSVLPLIQAELAHGPNDNFLVKQLIGAVGLAMVAGAPLGGYLADRLGLRRMLLIASVVYTIAGTAGLYLGNLPALLVSRLFLGVAAASIQVMSLTLINTKLAGSDRAKWMGIHISVAMFGTIAVHPIAGALGEISWRLPFALYALGAVLVIAMATDRSLNNDAQPAKAKQSDRAQTRATQWFPYHYLLLGLMIGSLVFLPSVYLPFLLRQQQGATPFLISLVLTADSLVGALMALIYGSARKRLDTYGAYAISFTTIGAGTLLAALSSSLAGIVGGMLIYGLGVGWLVPNLITGLADKVPLDKQGRAAGFVKAAHFLAAPLCITLVEPFTRKYGPANALLIVSCLAAIMLIAVGIRRKLKSKRNPVAASA